MHLTYNLPVKCTINCPYCTYKKYAASNDEIKDSIQLLYDTIISDNIDDLTISIMSNEKSLDIYKQVIDKIHSLRSNISSFDVILRPQDLSKELLTYEKIDGLFISLDKYTDLNKLDFSQYKQYITTMDILYVTDGTDLDNVLVIADKFNIPIRLTPIISKREVTTLDITRKIMSNKSIIDYGLDSKILLSPCMSYFTTNYCPFAGNSYKEIIYSEIKYGCPYNLANICQKESK